MHPVGQSRTSEALAALCIATLGEGVAVVLFLIMLAVWVGIGSGRI